MSETRIHELKLWPKYFDDVVEGRKTFEIRKNDRDYREGDILKMKEWDPATGEYTGREVMVVAVYVTTLPYQDDVVGMSIIVPRSHPNRREDPMPEPNHVGDLLISDNGPHLHLYRHGYGLGGMLAPTTVETVAGWHKIASGNLEELGRFISDGCRMGNQS